MNAKVHQITGISPKTPEGSVELFTVLAKPFVVDAAWLDAQEKEPAVGDFLEDNDGVLTLATDTDVSDEAAADIAANGPLTVTYADGTTATRSPGSPALPLLSPAEQDAADAQKKTDGGTDLSGGAEASVYDVYAAKPFLVKASRVASIAGSDNTMTATLENGYVVAAANVSLTLGDYFVMDRDEKGFMNGAKFEEYFELQG